MPTLIKNRQIAENEWQVVDETTISSGKGKIIVPLDLYSQLSDSLCEKMEKGEVALLLQSHQNIEDLPENFSESVLIAIDFPTFMDGRGYTIARELREIKNYKGEIRAVGDVLHDQLSFMERCGFDAFELADGIDTEKALEAFSDFSSKYQKDSIESNPVYQRS